jgi:hypothetical protein
MFPATSILLNIVASHSCAPTNPSAVRNRHLPLPGAGCKISSPLSFKVASVIKRESGIRDSFFISTKI